MTVPSGLFTDWGFLWMGDADGSSTNLVARPSAQASELSVVEMRESVPALLRKLIPLKPKSVPSSLSSSSPSPPNKSSTGLNFSLDFSGRIINFVGLGIAKVVLWYFFHHLLPLLPRSSAKVKPPSVEPKIGFQPFTISYDPRWAGFGSSEGGIMNSDEEGKEEKEAGEGEEGERRLIYFYSVPSTSARVVYYQVPSLPSPLSSSSLD